METHRDYPLSRKAYKDGQRILSNGTFGLLGLGMWAAEGMARMSENETREGMDAGREVKPSCGRSIALVPAFVIPLGFLLMRAPFIGEIAFMVIFAVFTEVMSEEYPFFRDIGLGNRLLCLLMMWGYGFVIAYMLEDYMNVTTLLSLVPVLCFVLGYMKGWWQNKKGN